MGNYLLSLRVPPPTPDEDERNHPLYYDWSIPKYSPFREPTAPKAATTAAERQPAVSQASKTPVNVNRQPSVSGASSKTSAVASNAARNIADRKTLKSPRSAATKLSGATSTGAHKSAVAVVSQTGAMKSDRSGTGQSVNIDKSATKTAAAAAAAATAKGLSQESSESSLKGVVTKVMVGKMLVPAAKQATKAQKSVTRATGRNDTSPPAAAISSREVGGTKKT